MQEHVVEEIVQSGPYIGNEVGVRFVNNEVKNKQSSITKR
jgi:hypothetical protein